jgi:hypothetical protein
MAFRKNILHAREATAKQLAQSFFMPTTADIRYETHRGQEEAPVENQVPAAEVAEAPAVEAVVQRDNAAFKRLGAVAIGPVTSALRCAKNTLKVFGAVASLPILPFVAIHYARKHKGEENGHDKLSYRILKNIPHVPRHLGHAAVDFVRTFTRLPMSFIAIGTVAVAGVTGYLLGCANAVSKCFKYSTDINKNGNEKGVRFSFSSLLKGLAKGLTVEGVKAGYHTVQKIVEGVKDGASLQPTTIKKPFSGIKKAFTNVRDDLVKEELVNNAKRFKYGVEEAYQDHKAKGKIFNNAEQQPEPVAEAGEGADAQNTLRAEAGKWVKHVVNQNNKPNNALAQKFARPQQPVAGGVEIGG